MSTNTLQSLTAPAPVKAKLARTGDPVTQQPQPIQMNMKPTTHENHQRGHAQRLRGGGAGKDCFLGLCACFVCFECCEGCCDCIGDIICCPCEMCC